MDFLLTADAQDILQQYTDGPFHARRFLCSATLTKISGTSKRCSDNTNQHHFLFSHVCEDTDRLLKAISCSKDLEFASLDVTMHQIESTLGILRKTKSLYSSTCSSRITNFLELLDTAGDILMRVAIEYNIPEYVRKHVTASIATGTRKESLLKYALFPVFPADPSPEIVSCVIEAGETPDWFLDWSKWWEFLAKLSRKFQGAPISIAKVQIVELLMKHKVVSNCPRSFDYLFKYHKVFLDAKLTDITIENVLEILAITDTQLDRLLSILHDAEQAEVLDPRNVESKETKPAKRKQARAQSPRRTQRRKTAQSSGNKMSK